MGAPTAENWPDGYKLALQKNLEIPESNGIDLKYLVNNCSKYMLDIL